MSGGVAPMRRPTACWPMHGRLQRARRTGDDHRKPARRGPAAATLGATGSFATEAAKLNAALPKLKAAADAYPDTAAGITARYHYASSLAALGRHDEADQDVRRCDEPGGRNTCMGGWL